MAAGSITVRELLVRLGVEVKTDDKEKIKAFDAKISSVKENMQSASTHAHAMAAGIADLARWAAYGAAALGGVIAALGWQAAATATASREIVRQSDALGMTTAAYQEYSGVFQQFGIDAEKTSAVFGHLATQASAAAAGSAETAKLFQELGVSLADLKKMTPDQLFEATADGIAKTTDATKRLAIANRLFGDENAKRLLPALMKGKAGLRGLRRELEQTGAVISEKDLKVSAKLADDLGELGRKAEGLRNQLGAALAPALDYVVTRMSAWIDANQAWVRQDIAAFAARITDGFHRIGAAVRAADEIVRHTIGTWKPVLIGVIAAMSAAVGFFLAFKVGGVVVEGLLTVNALLTAMGVLLGVELLPMWALLGAAILSVAGMFLFLAIPVEAVLAPLAIVAVYLDDVITYLRGGRSELGAFVDAWADVPGVLGGVARIVRDLRDLLLALADSTSPFREAVDTGIVGALNAIEAAGASALATLRALAETVSLVSGIDIPGAVSGALDSIDVGIRQTTAGVRGGPSTPPAGAFAPTGTPTVGGSRSTTTVNAPTTNTFNITGDDPREIAAQVSRTIASQQHRQALASVAGGTR